MSSEYMSTGDESASTEDSMNTEHPDPAEHLRTHQDEIPAEDAALASRPDLQPDSQGGTPLDAELGDVHEQQAQAVEPESGETRNQRNP